MDNKDNVIDLLSDTHLREYFVRTNHLRYVRKQIEAPDGTATYELRLQVMLQGSLGTQKWQWVEVVE